MCIRDRSNKLMKKIKLFIFLSVSFLLVGCTNKKNHINIHKVSIYVDLDYKAEKKEYIRLWINDKMIFSNYSNSWRTYIASISAVSYTHLRAHETRHDLVCRLLLEKKKNDKIKINQHVNI
eukprot:TRINITY_DN38369_c0_g1_i1.p1 TRINITY_DN38369_c0_g1~~TRINITY_DN38369_c0_g1_i1.p1  ORF type:complete len:121 (-),score=19.04 TRINITY_DN38369_c0_g1_i1:55-417(-)